MADRRLTAAEFHARIRQAGIPMSEAETAAIHTASATLDAWLALLRQPLLGPEAEPATTFTAEARP